MTPDGTKRQGVRELVLYRPPTVGIYRFTSNLGGARYAPKTAKK